MQLIIVDSCNWASSTFGLLVIIPTRPGMCVIPYESESRPLPLQNAASGSRAKRHGGRQIRLLTSLHGPTQDPGGHLPLRVPAQAVSRTGPTLLPHCAQE